MKLTSCFTSFLKDTVNLNQTRIADLERSIEAIQRFIRQSTWKPSIRGFEEQGSWAHDTIIKPVDQREFDADLLVMVDPVDGWTAKDYVKELGKVFKASATYGDMTKTWDYCVTITYANERKIDIAPCIVDRAYVDTYEVCNAKIDTFENSAPIEYTQWMKDQNSYSGSNSFRKVTRLVKYLRDIKLTFSCPSVLLTTLLGNHIYSWDKGSDAFADVPTALKTIMGRLDDWLQERPFKPEVRNPKLWSEDFASSWADEKYSNFRDKIHRYRGWIDEAYDALTRSDSIIAWRRVFGSEFAKGETVELKKSLNEASAMARVMVASNSTYQNDLVRDVLIYGTAVVPTSITHPAHQTPSPWPISSRPWIDIYITATHQRKKSRAGKIIGSGDVIAPTGGLMFNALLANGQHLPHDCHIRWRITNTGAAAMLAGCGRGDFYSAEKGNTRWEPLQYHGVHTAEAFLVSSDGTLRGQSLPFHVVLD
ncbi:SMODS domain-containing nucleotidyltransferase [Sphingomonas pituitosa]|uniref:SMODS domain-containing nucleotidyltransferase n=1 Tax=Sphingomonas pituitosa TaxID=99597 RepID=UPI00082BD7FD|nr:nucleotidyltransferase [Sphingomonas pituitosa]